MERLPEEIAKRYENKDGLANRRAIIKHFRQLDESHLKPIKGNFNVTERALRRLKTYENCIGHKMYGLELCLWLDREISDIINNPKNW